MSSSLSRSNLFWLHPLGVLLLDGALYDGMLEKSSLPRASPRRVSPAWAATARTGISSISRRGPVLKEEAKAVTSFYGEGGH